MKIGTSLTGKPPNESPAGEARTGRVDNGCQGFSLLELIIVLAILSLLMGLAGPNVYHSWERQRGRAGVRQFVALLRLARSAAAAQQQPQRVVLDLESGSYWLQGSKGDGRWLPGTKVLEPRLVWQNSSRRLGFITFYGDGSSSGGRLALSHPKFGYYIIEVEMVTGRISLDSKG